MPDLLKDTEDLVQIDTNENENIGLAKGSPSREYFIKYFDCVTSEVKNEEQEADNSNFCPSLVKILFQPIDNIFTFFRNLFFLIK